MHGYILVYSIASRASLEKLRNVNKMLFTMIGNPPGIPRVLVATMLDALEQRYTHSYSLEDKLFTMFILEVSGVTVLILRITG